MTDNQVIIAGGGIGGLAMALTLHQIGVPCIVLDAVQEMRPLGVGINLQPNAVRELYDLGFTEEDLNRVGDPQRIVFRRHRHAPPTNGLLPDLSSGPGDRIGHDQLDRRGHDG